MVFSPLHGIQKSGDSEKLAPLFYYALQRTACAAFALPALPYP